MRILLLLLCAATAGCTGFTKPFMGVPEYKTVHYEDDDPQTIFRGVPKLTAVHQTEYRNFLLAMREGRIVAQERRGTTMYFAVAVPRCVQFEDAPPDAARGAYVIVTERYKAKMPEAPPKILPKDDLRPPSSLQPKPPKPKTLKTVKPPSG